MKTPMTQVNNLRIATLNVQGLQKQERKLAIKHLLTKHRIDVLLMQEVAFAQDNHFAPDYNLLVNTAERKNSGTACLIKKHLNPTNVRRGGAGRILQMELNGKTITNIYAPAGKTREIERNKFYTEDLMPYVTGNHNTRIVAGDFNAVEDPDHRTSKARNNREATILKTLYKALDVTDVWSACRPKEQGFTHQGPHGAARLDRIYITKSEVNSVQDIRLETFTYSDHQCVIMDIHEQHDARKKEPNKHYKLNTALLKEQNYGRFIQEKMEKARSQSLYEEDPTQWWEIILKPEIKRETIKYAARRNKWKEATMQYTEQCIEQLISEKGQDEELLEELKGISRAWQEDTLEGLKIRAREEADTEGEPGSLYHLHRVRRRAQQESRATASPAGQTTQGQDQMAEETATIYEELLNQQARGEQEIEQDFLNEMTEIDVKKFNLDRPITKQELHDIIRGAKKNKTPGIDGIPTDFYLAMWKEIGDDFTKMANGVLQQRRTVTTSQGHSIIKLIPKTPNPKVLNDYRPIALLCADYKIMAAAINRRLRSTLQQTITQEQKGAVPGRNPQQILALVRDMTTYLNNRSTPGAIVSLDLAKAYDLVNRGLIWRTLEKIGYPEGFVGMVKACYEVCTMTVNLGTTQTKTITATTSIRQGCPLSAALFIIYLDPLLRKIKKNIRGVNCLGTRIQVAAYMDDVNVFAESEDDMIAIQETIKKFSAYTGARLNTSKTKTNYLGTWERSKKTEYSWTQKTDHLRILGITFYNNTEDTIINNWTEAQNGLLGTTNMNRQRCLDFFQRAQFIKERCISKSLHLAHILPCPPAVAENMRKITHRFIWNNHREKTNPRVLPMKVQDGGLNAAEPGLWFQAIYMSTTFKHLRQSTTAFNCILKHWLDFALRNTLEQSTDQRKPHAFIGELPAYIRPVPAHLTSLITQGILKRKDATLDHRKMYRTQLEDYIAIGKMERRLPQINWSRAWRNLKQIPAKYRETIFKLNHNILPIGDRLRVTKVRDHDNCEDCQMTQEDTDHFLQHCPKKKEAIVWLQKEKEKKGLGTTPMKNFLHLDTDRYNKQANLLAAIYVNQAWKSRKNGRLMSTAELALTWSVLQNQNTTTTQK